MVSGCERGEQIMDSIEILDQFEKAIDEAKWALKGNITLRDDIKRKNQQIEDKDKTIKLLRYEKRIIEKLLKVYELEFGKKYQICPECDGYGGFDAGEEGGYPCDRCEETGYISILLEKKED